MGPDYERPEIETAPIYMRSAAAGESAANMPWWEILGDEVLQDLIREALGRNRDLRAAIARIDQARANLGFTKADMYPQIGFGIGAQTVDSSDEVGDADVRFDQYFAAPAVTYEVDLWGKLRRSREAARAELLEQESQKE